MFERYTKEATRAIFFARAQASRCGAHTIDPVHLLSGLFWEKSNSLDHVVRDENARALFDHLNKQATATEQIALEADMPLSEVSTMALTRAASEADRLNDQAIGPEHLLLGLLREDAGSQDLLEHFGVDVKTVVADLSLK